MLKGIGVTSGIAIGKAYVLQEFSCDKLPSYCKEPAAEEADLRRATAAACAEIKELIKNQSGEMAEILKSHLNFAEDPAFNDDAVEKIYGTNCNAAQALQSASQELQEVFLSFEDAYMRERVADIRDVGGRILRCLLGGGEEALAALPEGTILIASDLAPSQTAQIAGGVTGFVTEGGGSTGHTAIMARAMNIAAVVACEGILQRVVAGDTVVVNGASGEVAVNPDAEQMQDYLLMKEKDNAQKLEAAKTKDVRLRREDGRPVLVAANIGTAEQAYTAKQAGADGIGLFRTEFLYMDRSDMPTEQEQFEAYCKVAEVFGDAPVIIRTLDIGGDKSLPYLPMKTEENPFLGVRAIRLCLAKPDVFMTQLRAVLRASVYGNLKIMFPMIGGIKELHDAKALLEVCKNQLDEQQMCYNKNIEVGMMIEVPAAAVCAADFAREVDFFSIGTNDLTQYTIAVDRGNAEIAYLYDSMHPAVRWLIQNTIEAAGKAGIFCGMCGELAGDERAISWLAECGLDEFSVGIDSVAATKAILLGQECIRAYPGIKL